jgi:23S rRNA pseudouridine1911/1915/1917 synthase
MTFGCSRMILFEDHHLIVVNKPAGLLTQAPADVPSLEATVKAYIKEKYQKPAGVYLGVPHRLDRPVSGVVVFTRNTKASQRVHQQFQERTTVKTYWAIVSLSDDEQQPQTGTWTNWIRKLPEQSRVEEAKEGDANAKFAKLNFRFLKQSANQALLELNPETGRSHQLRVQCAWRGMPILGDEQYGSTIPFHGRIALHARELQIVHPFTKQPLSFVAPLPTEWPEELALF